MLWPRESGVMANKKILLIEPGYKNKYPPLGLMKIAQYHGPNGKRDNVKFIKGPDKSVLDTCWDKIYVTTLFSFEWKKISEAIEGKQGRDVDSVPASIEDAFV